MKSEILTLSQDEIENIKEELCRILGYRCKDKIEVINEVNINNFGFAHDKKKHKNLFIISNKEEKLLDLEINLKELSSLTDMDYQIKFEGCRINFTDFLSEEKIKIGQNLYFNNCDFKAIELKNICFKNFEIDRYRYESDQKKPIVFRACEFKELSLNNSIFSESIKFEEETKIKYLDINLSEFKKYFFMQNCIIEKINLWKNKFKNRCYFVDSKFGYKDKVNKAELNFSNAHFEDNAYFNNSEFYNYADFHECKFDNIACFYGVKFYKAPNFSACYFKEQKAANLINVDIDELNFESVEKYIKDNYQDETYENKQEITEEQRDNNCKLKCAKHLKDSFRVIKDILITQNNALEAQEWHKLELYAKEKEIAIKAKSAIDVTDCKNASAKFLKEELYDFTEWVNFVLLFIYRNASSHHTSFLKILNFTVVMIALYASFVWWLQIDCAVQFVYEFIFITAFIVVVIIAFLSYIIYKSAFKLRIFRFLLFLGMGCGIFLLFFFQNLEPIIIYCYILLVSFFSWIFFSKKLSRFFVLILAYIVFFSVLIEKPQFINPFTGVFSSDKLYESQFEKSLNDLNTSAIINLASISQNDFNLHLKDQNISFTELNSAKVLIVANKEKLKEVLSKVYNDKHVSDYKKVLSELENNTSNVKNIIEEIDNKNNNSVVSAQLNKFLKLNFSQEIDSLYMIKRNFSTSEKLSPEQMALFDQKDSQDKLKNVLSLLKFKSRFEGVLKVINRDEIIQNTIKSTSVLYGIILLLCIFSLQKTARKNSIVPS